MSCLEISLVSLENQEKNFEIFLADNFIAICCDGIFDVMSNDDLIGLVIKRIPYHKSLSTLCESVADFCCHKVRLTSSDLQNGHFGDPLKVPSSLGSLL